VAAIGRSDEDVQRAIAETLHPPNTAGPTRGTP
jgi:hypothetical protein